MNYLLYLYPIYMGILLKELLYDLKEDFKSQERKFIDRDKMEEKTVKAYIEFFKKIRDMKPKVARDSDIKGLEVNKGNDRFDIDKYSSFRQLEMFVDYVRGQMSMEKGKFYDIKVDGKPIAHGHGLEIFYANSKHACITYKGDKPYSWCVSRSDASNMYYNYRYGQGEPSFYFVKDLDEMEEEFAIPFEGEFRYPYHFFVIQATDNPNEFIVTSANNDGDQEMSWDEILEQKPNLKYFREIFKHHPLTGSEKELKNRFLNKDTSDEAFSKFTYEEKEAYLDIAIPKYELTDNKFADLPRELKNKYIGYGVGVSEGMYDMIKDDKELMKRFVQISVRKTKQVIQENRIDLLTKPEFEAAISDLSYRPELAKTANFIFIAAGLDFEITLVEMGNKLGLEALQDILFTNEYKGSKEVDSSRLSELLAAITTDEDHELFSELVRRNVPKLATVENLFSHKFYGKKYKNAKNKDTRGITDSIRDGELDPEILSQINTLFNRLSKSLKVVQKAKNGKIGMDDVESVLQYAQIYLRSNQIEIFKKYLIDLVKNDNVSPAWYTANVGNSYVPREPKGRDGIVSQFIHKYIQETADIDEMIKEFGIDAVKKSLMEPVNFDFLITQYRSPKKKEMRDIWDLLKKIHSIVGTEQMKEKFVGYDLGFFFQHYVYANNFEDAVNLFGEEYLKDRLPKALNGDNGKMEFLKHLLDNKQSFFRGMLLVKSLEQAYGKPTVFNMFGRNESAIIHVLDFIITASNRLNEPLSRMLEWFGGKKLISAMEEYPSTFGKILIGRLKGMKDIKDVSDYVYNALFSHLPNERASLFGYTIPGKALCWLLLTRQDWEPMFERFERYVTLQNLINVLVEYHKDPHKYKESLDTVRKRIISMIPNLTKYRHWDETRSKNIESANKLKSKDDYELFKTIITYSVARMDSKYYQWEIIELIQVLALYHPEHFDEIFSLIQRFVHHFSPNDIQYISPEHIRNMGNISEEIYKKLEDILKGWNENSSYKSFITTQNYNIDTKTGKSLAVPSKTLKERHEIYRNYFI